MKITLASVVVKDQAKALSFYTEQLGFKKQQDLPMGEHRWLTVSAPDGIDGVELLLEPLGFPPAAAYQAELYEAGIPANAFQTNDLKAEVAQLKERGLVFRSESQRVEGALMAIFDDTCGNLICLTQADEASQAD